MPNVVVKALSDTLAGLADIRGFDEDHFCNAATDDLFLCALGFEPRCLALPERLCTLQYSAHRAVCFTYETNVEDNEANSGALQRHLEAITPKAYFMNCDSEDFAGRLRNALESVSSTATQGIPKVTLDVSVTANRLLVTCIKVLLEYDCRLRLLYSEADVYHPTREEYDRNPGRWTSDSELGLERGVDKVISSVDHPGHALDPLPDCVIVFPSFKQDRSRAVISAVDPSLLTNPAGKVLWLLGKPHLTESHWRLDAMKTINGIASDAPQVEVCTFDYKETLGVLDRLYWERVETHNIALSPLGSKMQALGTALFCHMHPDVRIIFATPVDYNATQYSDGCRDVWCIDFGSLVELRRKLEETGTLAIVD